MNEKQIIWTFISNFVVAQGYYPDPTTIKNAFPNDVPLTMESQFVIITRLGPKEESLPQNTFNVESQTMTLSNQQEISYQLDFYGPPAADSSSAMIGWLRSYAATNQLRENGYGIADVQPAQQLTKDLDRGNYVSRYVVRFSILYLSEITYAQDGIGYDDINVIPISLN